ncbi:mitochondrial phosphate carrier protein 3, mitochondrial-like [Miscanthus floridulus]|uniref:mitochondrial phosphate carrier protein 3, mitochondrial-like n=1 Tax=Miscanthus floridulus TaxID=154761 RepID=UPI0034599655
MAVSESSLNALLPSFLYTALATASPFAAAAASVGGQTVAAPSAATAAAARPASWARAPSEPGRRIEMYSPPFYAACMAGGVSNCGLTHMTVTPLDLVKCNMQIDPAKYKRISSGFGVLLKEQGPKGFFRGWVPTPLGYSAQGACKFDIALCPMEAAKVRVQTQPGFARGLSDGLPKFVKAEGYSG